MANYASTKLRASKKYIGKLIPTSFSNTKKSSLMRFYFLQAKLSISFGKIEPF
jgi:hypothetical protein